MFSGVCLFTGDWGVGYLWYQVPSEGVGYAWYQVPSGGVVRVSGGRVSREWRPLPRLVRILLECFLVTNLLIVSLVTESGNVNVLALYGKYASFMMKRLVDIVYYVTTIT